VLATLALLSPLEQVGLSALATIFGIAHLVAELAGCWCHISDWLRCMADSHSLAGYSGLKDQASEPSVACAEDDVPPVLSFVLNSF
jgi:hypothetical protein